MVTSILAADRASLAHSREKRPHAGAGPVGRARASLLLVAVQCALAVFLPLAPVDAAATASSPAAAQTLEKTHAEILGRIVADVGFGEDLSRFIAERTRKESVRAYAQGALTEFEEISRALIQAAKERGFDVTTHPTDRSGISGAGRTDNIGQVRGPNQADTPTENIPAEAQARGTTTPRAVPAPAGPAPSHSALTPAGVEAAIGQRYETYLRNLDSVPAEELDREFVTKARALYREISSSLERFLTESPDGELRDLTSVQFRRLASRDSEIDQLEQLLKNP